MKLSLKENFKFFASNHLVTIHSFTKCVCFCFFFGRSLLFSFYFNLKRILGCFCRQISFCCLSRNHSRMKDFPFCSFGRLFFRYIHIYFIVFALFSVFISDFSTKCSYWLFDFDTNTHSLTNTHTNAIHSHKYRWHRVERSHCWDENWRGTKKRIKLAKIYNWNEWCEREILIIKQKQCEINQWHGINRCHSFKSQTVAVCLKHNAFFLLLLLLLSFSFTFSFSFLDSSSSEWAISIAWKTIDVNLVGTFFFSRWAFIMKRSDSIWKRKTLPSLSLAPPLSHHDNGPLFICYSVFFLAFIQIE